MSNCPSCGFLLQRPAPDRVGLIRLLKQHLTPHLDYESSPHKPFVDDLMAWATGTPATPTWCKHIVWQSEGWGLKHVDDDHLWIQVLPRTWDCCPIAGCHAPRPTAVKKDLLARATGTPVVPKAWCKHIYQDPFGQTKLFWYLRTEPSSLDAEVFDDWTVCPICAAPRPAEGRG